MGLDSGFAGVGGWFMRCWSHDRVAEWETEQLREIHRRVCESVPFQCFLASFLRQELDGDNCYEHDGSVETCCAGREGNDGCQ